MYASDLKSYVADVLEEALGINGILILTGYRLTGKVTALDFGGRDQFS